MALDFSCPISGEQRDNNAVRIVAAQVVLVSVVALVVAFFAGPYVAAVIMGLLAIDFIIRAFIKPRYSPLATVARGITSGLGLKKVMVDSAPKVFAARIGVLFSVGSSILFGLALFVPGVVVLSILIVCALLESAFSFCLGCWAYVLLPKGARTLLSTSILQGHKS